MSSNALYQSVKDVALGDKKTQVTKGGRHLLPVSLALPGNPQLAETLIWDLAKDRDQSMAVAAAERLGQEWNLHPQSEAHLRNHIASSLECLSSVPADGSSTEQLIDIDLDIRDDNGATVFKDRIQWNVNDVQGRISGPETFAFVTCADRGLPPKYRARGPRPLLAKIAGAIRERIQLEAGQQPPQQQP